MSQTLLSISGDLITDELEGFTTILDANTGNYITLNQTGTVIWNGLMQGKSEAEIVQHLIETYVVSPQQAKADLLTLLQELNEQPFVS